jgi:hypothetical protein
VLAALLANASVDANLTELRAMAAYFQPAPWPKFKLLLDPVPAPPAFSFYGAAIGAGALLLSLAYYLSTSIRRELACRCGACLACHCCACCLPASCLMP